MNNDQLRINKYQLTEGYKQTEVGVIPEDWDVISIEELGDVIRGASPRPKGDKRYYGGNIPRLMVEDVTRDEKFVTPSVDFLTEEGAKRSRPCSKGTLTLVCSGTVGIPSFLAIDACIHDGFLALVDVKKKVNSDFIYHFLKTQQSQFNNSATHGGVFTNLTTEIFINFRIPLPQHKKEQRLIAQALSDVDALIAALDKLIAKKRHLKTATMQQLLTGKKRLPGFGKGQGYKESAIGLIPQDWDAAKLGDIAEVIMGQSPKGTSYNRDGNGLPLINGPTEFTEKHPIKVQWTTEPTKLCKSEDLLLCVRGSSTGRMNVANDEFCIGRGVAAIRANAKANTEYLTYQVYLAIEGLLSLSAGSTFPSVDAKAIKSIFIPCPDPQEQHAIATVLSDMDAEIAALETRLAKTQVIKQGMMQQLLTGKTRLL